MSWSAAKVFSIGTFVFVLFGTLLPFAAHGSAKEKSRTPTMDVIGYVRETVHSAFDRPVRGIATGSLLLVAGLLSVARRREPVLPLKGIFGSSRWLTDRELFRAEAFRAGSDGGIVLGQSASKAHGLPLSAVRVSRLIQTGGDEHVLLVAPPGRGKGVSVVIPTLLAWRGSTVVYDIKGENYEASAGWRCGFSRIHRFDPTSPTSAKFNPLEEVDVDRPETAVGQVQNICDLLTNPEGEEHHDHWRSTARQLLVGAVLHVLYAERERSLHGVVRLLNDPESDISGTLNRMRTTPHLGGRPHPLVEETARNMLNKERRELSGVLSTASSFLATYQDPIVARNTSSSDFRLGDLTSQTHPHALFLCVSPENASRMRPLTRLLLEMIGNRLTRSLTEGVHPMLFLLDEFPSLGRLPFFEKQLAFFRQYRLRCLLVAQSFSQLFGTYGRDTSILDNCRTKVVLGSGAPADARLVSQFLGAASVATGSVTSAGRDGTRGSVTVSETRRALLTEDEILRLPPDQLLLLRDGFLPYRAKRVIYYHDPRFRPRAGLPTPRVTSRSETPPSFERTQRPTSVPTVTSLKDDAVSVGDIEL